MPAVPLGMSARITGSGFNWRVMLSDSHSCYTFICPFIHMHTYVYIYIICTYTHTHTPAQQVEGNKYPKRRTKGQFDKQLKHLCQVLYLLWPLPSMQCTTPLLTNAPLTLLHCVNKKLSANWN